MQAAVAPGAAVAAAAAGAVVQAAAANPNFSKSPGISRANDDLDMTNEADQKLYREATSSFTKKNELFDLSSGRLMTYMEKLTERCSEYGWNEPITGITYIPEDPLDAATEYDNLLTNYGQIKIDRVRAFEETYLHLPVRAANDSDMLYKCQMKSLTEEAVSKLRLVKHLYHVNGEPSGNLLLRVIIQKSSLDSNASVSIIRNKLARLDEYMPQIKSNILEFTEYVQGLLQDLGACGEITTDLLFHLFAAYKVASDASFREMARDEELLFERGVPMTPEGLMAVMLARWETLTDKGEWNAPSKEEEQLMVLRTELEALKTARKSPPKGDLLQKLKEKLQKKLSVKKKKSQVKYNGKAVSDPPWLANNEKPSPLTKTMHHRNKAWHWCAVETGGKCDGRWRVHKPSECKGTAGRGGGRTESVSNKGSSNELKLMKVLNAVIGDDDEVCRMIEDLDMEEDEEE
jgi:hypothetical protein